MLNITGRLKKLEVTAAASNFSYAAFALKSGLSEKDKQKETERLIAAYEGEHGYRPGYSVFIREV